MENSFIGYFNSIRVNWKSFSLRFSVFAERMRSERQKALELHRRKIPRTFAKKFSPQEANRLKLKSPLSKQKKPTHVASLKKRKQEINN